MKLTDAQIRILRVADEIGSVDAHAQWRRAVERLAAKGLLYPNGNIVRHCITPAGRAALSDIQQKGRTVMANNLDRELAERQLPPTFQDELVALRARVETMEKLFNPASEAAMRVAVELEIEAAIGHVTTKRIGELIEVALQSSQGETSSSPAAGGPQNNAEPVPSSNAAHAGGGHRASFIAGLEADAWDRLINMDDRTSPEEYPDHCLITREEIGGIITDAISAITPPQEAADEQDFLRGLVDWVWLHAREGSCWPSTKTADELITKAGERRPTQDDAEAYIAASPSPPAQQTSPAATDGAR